MKTCHCFQAEAATLADDHIKCPPLMFQLGFFVSSLLFRCWQQLRSRRQIYSEPETLGNELRNWFLFLELVLFLRVQFAATIRPMGQCYVNRVSCYLQMKKSEWSAA